MAYRSVTLAPGESYVLPAGATIISADNPGLISSQNDCADLTKLEDLVCYVFVLMADTEHGSATHVWEGNSSDPNVWLRSITIGGATYSLSSIAAADSLGRFDVAALKTLLESNSGTNGIMISITTSGGTASNSNGGISTLCFKTLPSIGDDAYLTVETALQSEGSPTPVTTVRVYAQNYDDYAANHVTFGLCECSNPTT